MESVDETDIFSILNEGKNTNTPDYKKIYSVYNTCCIKTILELKSKLDKKINYIDMGISILFYLFFLIIRYTNNIVLCLKYSERAILLYTEFIIQSTEKKKSGDLIFSPSIGDAVAFSYAKTLGDLNITMLEKNNKQDKNMRKIMKSSECMNHIYMFFSRDNNIDFDIFQKIKLNLYNDIYYIFLNNEINDISLILNKNYSMSKTWIALRMYIYLYIKKSYIPVYEFIEIFDTINILQLNFIHTIDLKNNYFKLKAQKWFDD